MESSFSALAELYAPLESLGISPSTTLSSDYGEEDTSRFSSLYSGGGFGATDSADFDSHLNLPTSPVDLARKSSELSSDAESDSPGIFSMEFAKSTSGSAYSSEDTIFPSPSLDEAKLLSSTHDRCETQFHEGAKVFHAIFGVGVVEINDGTYLSISFDDPKYGEMKLKAFYAVPKMVVIG